jgi:hypothetical protein
MVERHRHDENSPLVILDTVGKARPQRRAGDDPTSRTINSAPA